MSNLTVYTDFWKNALTLPPTGDTVEMELHLNCVTVGSRVGELFQKTVYTV
jgi:hypothetical protein